MSKVPDGVLALIGRTPMLKLAGFDTGPCELFLKLESQNPGGSIKDRIGLSMIAAAERDGKLGPHQRHLVEATAGNTGLGLALVAAQRGYRLTLVIPDKMSQEKVFHLKALGADVVMTRSDVEKGHPGCEMILADPEGSVLAEYVKTGRLGKAGSWLVEGIGEDFIPPIADLSRVKRAYSIPDRESLETARLLLRRSGVLAGSSSGTLLAAALRYCREQPSPKRVCTLVCDSGNKYLSKMYNEFWMADQGLSDRPRTGDLRDVIARRHADRATVTVKPDDTLLVAYARMKLYDVSQLPVLEGDRVVGMVDESDLLVAALDDTSRLRAPVRDVMSTRLRTVPPSTPIRELMPLFEAGLVPLVVDGGELVGLVTKIDLLNYLRRRLS